MSIVGLALRMSAVQALMAAGTLAGSRVFDSAFLPIDQLSGEDAEPVISISTEDENDKPAGRDLSAGSRVIDFVVEIAIARAVPLPAKDGEEALVQIVVPESDATLELAIAILTRQINTCLFGRGGGEWGDIFRALFSNVQDCRARRGIPVKDGQRLAARQMTYSVQTIAEPPFVAELEERTPLAAFLAKIEATPALAEYGAILREAIEGTPLDWPAFWTKTALLGGYTEAEAAMIGIADPGPGAVQISEVEVLPDGLVFDQEAVDANVPPIPDEP